MHSCDPEFALTVFHKTQDY